MLEVARKAYAVRDMYVTDPRYMPVSVDNPLSREFLERIKLSFRDTTALPYSGDTTFFAVADSSGWIVAGIQSLFHPFGSYVTEPRFNITLNSRASSFSLDPSSVNRLEPRKKTMHTLSAIILEENSRVLAIGLTGGHYRPLLHAQLVTNIVDYEMKI